MSDMLFPPGPDAAQAADQLPTLLDDPVGALERLVEEFGPMVGITVGEMRLMLINEPELARELLVVHQHDIVKGRGLQATKPLLGNGLLTSKGERHDCARRLVAPAFHRQRLDTYVAEMTSCTHARLDEWSAGERDVLADTTQIALDIVGRTLFGVDLGEDSAGISAALTAVLGRFAKAAPVFGVVGDMDEPTTQAVQRLDGIIATMIDDRRDTASQRHDLLSTLIAVRDEDGGRLSATEIRDETMTLLLAGHETTANALAWACGLLATHPEAMARLNEESRQSGDPMSLDQLAERRFARAVASEAMRLFPPAWALTRVTQRELTFGRYVAPAGTTYIVSPWLLHRDPRSWPDALAFRPERWLADDGGRHRFAYLPFGAGTRSCVGEQFAWTELIAVLAVVASRFRFESTPATRFEPFATVTLRPRDGMTVAVTSLE